MEHNKLAEIRNRKGLTQKQLADKLGVTQQTIWYYENGKREMKSSVLVSMSKALGCSVSELLGISNREGVLQVAKAPHKLIPIVGRVAAGEAREAIEQCDKVHPIPEGIYDDDDDLVWVEISGNSMNRCLLDGTLALVSLKKEVRNNDIAAVFVNGDDVTVKRILFEDDGIRLRPESYDPEYRDRFISSEDPNAPEVYIFGKVIGYTSPAGWRA